LSHNNLYIEYIIFKSIDEKDKVFICLSHNVLMKKGRVCIILIGIFLLFSILFVSTDFVDDGTLVQNVTACGTLNTTNAVYTLNQSISSSFDCLIINATNITLDCANYNITYGNATGGWGVAAVDEDTQFGVDNVTIRNCYLIQNESGEGETAIFFGEGSENAVVYNNTLEIYGNETSGIILGDDSVNANISLNLIYTNGTNSSGIEIADNGFNNIIEENLIVTVGNDSPGILMMDNVSSISIYNNIIWIMGNRTLSDIAMAGVLMDQNTYDLNISTNFIITGYLSGEIDDVDDYDVEEYESWLVKGGGYETAGIWVWGDNSTIDNNLIISFGELGNGIFLNDVEGINTTSNIIVTLGEQGHGILSEMSEDVALLFYNNLIDTFGENSSGINLRQDGYSNISSNTIETYGNYSYGVFFNQSSNITMVNNFIETGESTSYVLYLNTSSGNLIYNNLFNTSTTGSGVYINNSDMSDFNTTKTSATNIVGKSYVGGNYWANVGGTGYSDSCTEADGDYICDSSYTLIQEMDFIDYLPLTSSTSYEEPEDPPDSPSGGGYPIFRPTEEELIDGYTQNLFKNWKISFNVKNEFHTFILESIDEKSAKITISSELQEAIFFVGEEKRFELSGDNYYDLLVKLNSITFGKAEFTIQKIYEKVTNQIEENVAGGENEEEEEETLEEKGLKWWEICLIVLAGIIVLILIRYITFKKTKKGKQKRNKNKTFLARIWKEK